MKEINCPNCNQRIKIIGTIGYDLYKENLLNKEQEIKRLKEEYVMLQNASDKVEEDKKIEKLELVNNGNVNAYALLDDWGTKCALTKHSKIMVDKINEIIDKLNKEE